MQVQKVPLFETDDHGVKSEWMIDGVQFDGVEAVSCLKDDVRGNHHHEKKTEYIMVFSGKVKVEVEYTDGTPDSYELNPGDYVVIEPLVKHRVIGLEDSLLVVPFTGPASSEDVIKWESN